MKPFVIILSLALVACSSSPTATHYYQLPDSAVRIPTYASTNNEIAVQIVLAEHLQKEGLLYQTDDVHVNFAQKNVWGTPLADALSANLANKLNDAQSAYSYVPHKLIPHPKRTLKIYLDRFQGHYQGFTEISGYAQYADGRRRGFRVRTPQQGDGYHAMVHSLNQGLQQVAQQILN